MFDGKIAGLDCDCVWGVGDGDVLMPPELELLGLEPELLLELEPPEPPEEPD